MPRHGRNRPAKQLRHLRLRQPYRIAGHTHLKLHATVVGAVQLDLIPRSYGVCRHFVNPTHVTSTSCGTFGFGFAVCPE